MRKADGLRNVIGMCLVAPAAIATRDKANSKKRTSSFLTALLIIQTSRHRKRPSRSVINANRKPSIHSERLTVNESTVIRG